MTITEIMAALWLGGTAAVLANPDAKTAYVDVPEIKTNTIELVSGIERYNVDTAGDLAQLFGATGYVMVQPGVQVCFWPGQEAGDAPMGLGLLSYGQVAEWREPLADGSAWYNYTDGPVTMLMEFDGVTVVETLNAGEMVFINPEFRGDGLNIPDDGQGCQVECRAGYYACCYSSKKNKPVCRCRGETTANNDSDCYAGGHGSSNCSMVTTPQTPNP